MVPAASDTTGSFGSSRQAGSWGDWHRMPYDKDEPGGEAHDSRRDTSGRNFGSQDHGVSPVPSDGGSDSEYTRPLRRNTACLHCRYLRLVSLTPCTVNSWLLNRTIYFIITGRNATECSQYAVPVNDFIEANLAIIPTVPSMQDRGRSSLRILLPGWKPVCGSLKA
ncbi:hypothetical protein L218DRAFT_629780 [Marasmius fiardii PR-910]|nr:hypothetical protein L218DRAFT_629780 [Marasmius fiardii PR-910]